VAAGGGAACGLAGLGCAAAGFAGEFTDFEAPVEVSLVASVDSALPVPPFVSESPEAGFCTTFFRGSPLAGFATPVALLAAADAGAGFAANFVAGVATGLPASFGCGFAPVFPVETAPGTVAGLSGTEGSRRARISAARTLAPLCATGSRSSF
jgi:hypothetical protein